MTHCRASADDLSERSRFLLAGIGVLSLELATNVELLFELSLSLLYLLDRSAGCSEHEVHDHLQLLDSLILSFDPDKVIEIAADSQAQLVGDLLDHLPEVAVCHYCVLSRFLFHARVPLNPPNSQLALVVAVFHAPGLVNRCFIFIVKNVPGDRFVHIAQTIRGAIANNEFVCEFFQAKLIPYGLALLGPLQTDGERVVNLWLHLQKLA